MTPTSPWPAVTMSLSFGMYVKFASNELMLRSDGTVTGVGELEAVPPPPHAVAMIATTPVKPANVKRLSLPNCIPACLSSCVHTTQRFLLPSSRGPLRPRGESAPAAGLLSSCRRKHCSGRPVCQESVMAGGMGIRAIDKPAGAAMIPCGDGEEGGRVARVAAGAQPRPGDPRAARAGPDQPGRDREGDRPLSHDSLHAGRTAQGRRPRH